MTAIGAWSAVALMLALTTYGQIMLKFRVDAVGPIGGTGHTLAGYLIRLLVDPWVWSCFAAVALAGLCWMAAISRLSLTIAYPFISVTIAAVMIMSMLLLGEPLRLGHGIGIVMIGVGLFVIVSA